MAWDDDSFMPAPLAHLTGMTVGLTVPFTVGGAVALMDVLGPEAAVPLMRGGERLDSPPAPRSFSRRSCNAYEELRTEAPSSGSSRSAAQWWRRP